METLGETLGRLLSDDAPYQEPVIVPIPPLNPNFLTYAAAHFAKDFAFSGSLAFDDIWDVLISIPENMLSGLDSPVGWTALSAYVSQSCGALEAPLVPTVH